VKALVILLTYLVVYKTAMALKADPVISIMVISLAIFFAGNRFDIRAHLITDLFLSVLLLLLVSFSRKKSISRGKLYIFTAAIFFVWAQFHSGFVFGLLLIGIFIIGEFIRRRLSSANDPIHEGGMSGKRGDIPVFMITLAIAAVSSTASPSGYQSLIYPFLVMGQSPALRSVNEYLSPFSPVHGGGPVVHAFIVFLILGVLSFIPFFRKTEGLDRNHSTVIGAMLFTVFAALSVTMIRNTSMLAVLTAPFIACNITRIADKYRPKAASNIR